MLAQHEIIVGTVWPHLRAKVRRRRLNQATPADPKKEAPGVKFASWGVPNGLLETSWSVLGARSASGGCSGREKGGWKIVWRALGTVLGPSWRLLWGGARGGSGRFWRYFGVIFGGILGAQAEKLNMLFVQAFFMFVWVLSLFYLLSSVAFLAAWPAAPRTCKNLENPLVFVGRKPYAAFSRSARSKRISEDTRSQH